jgi:hypothetical protein
MYTKMNMRMLVPMLLVCLASFAVSMFGRDDTPSWVDEEVVLVYNIKRLAADGKYDDVYNLLSSEYKQGIQRDKFVDILRRNCWEVSSVEVGKCYRYKCRSYAPVRSVSTFGKIELRADAVIFFVNENGVWRVDNFPFVDPYIPDHVGIPKALRNE